MTTTTLVQEFGYDKPEGFMRGLEIPGVGAVAMDLGADGFRIRFLNGSQWGWGLTRQEAIDYLMGCDGAPSAAEDTPAASPSFPPLDDAISSVSRFIMDWDYVKTGQQIINAGLVVVAICHCLFIRALPFLVRLLKMMAKKLVSFSDWLANLSPTKASLLEKTVAELRLMGGKGKTKVQLVESLLMKK